MKRVPPFISVQWHITSRCGNRCKHCYMYDEATYANERKNALSYKGLLKVLNRFDEFSEKWGVKFRNFNITGGDPLLREEWKQFLDELKWRGKTVRMMGNPETLTEENAAALAERDVRAFQMSLDGLEATHDEMRSPGSFRRTVEALKRLHRYGIERPIMFTLYPKNASEMIPLLRYVAEETCASRFGFDIGCYMGEAASLEQNFTPKAIRDIFSRYLAEKDRLRLTGKAISIREKARLLSLTRFENKTLYPLSTCWAPVTSGCLAGWTSLSVLSDGTVLACRRLPIPVGKLPEQSLEEIFFGSELMKKLRRRESFAECGRCDFYQICRGCPANVYSVTGDPFARNPFCFRKLIDRKTHEANGLPPDPPLTNGYEEEFGFWASRYLAPDKETAISFAEAPEIRRLFVRLAYQTEERKAFVSDPLHYLKAKGIGLDDDQRFFLYYHFVDGPSDPEKQSHEEGTAAKFEAYILSRFLESD